MFMRNLEGTCSSEWTDYRGKHLSAIILKTKSMRISILQNKLPTVSVVLNQIVSTITFIKSVNLDSSIGIKRMLIIMQLFHYSSDIFNGIQTTANHGPELKIKQ